MAGRQMQGDNAERRATARAARAKGKKPSEVGATTGASKQRTEAGHGLTHQERLDLKKEGKKRLAGKQAHVPESRPRSRDSGTADRERYPRE